MIRNFWIDVDIDGRKTRLSGGPRNKDGGFSMTIYQRNKGQSVKALEIEGTIADDKLAIYVHDEEISVTHR